MSEVRITRDNLSELLAEFETMLRHRMHTEAAEHEAHRDAHLDPASRIVNAAGRERGLRRAVTCLQDFLIEKLLDGSEPEKGEPE